MNLKTSIDVLPSKNQVLHFNLPYVHKRSVVDSTRKKHALQEMTVTSAFTYVYTDLGQMY